MYNAWFRCQQISLSANIPLKCKKVFIQKGRRLPEGSLRRRVKRVMYVSLALKFKDHAHCEHILILRLSFTREVGLVAAEKS